MRCVGLCKSGVVRPCFWNGCWEGDMQTWKGRLSSIRKDFSFQNKDIMWSVLHRYMACVFLFLSLVHLLFSLFFKDYLADRRQNFVSISKNVAMISASFIPRPNFDNRSWFIYTCIYGAFYVTNSHLNIISMWHSEQISYKTLFNAKNMVINLAFIHS